MIYKERTITEFIEKRKKGAKKIVSETNNKEGPARLTHLHFAAKVIAYDECLKMLRNNESISAFESKFNSAHAKLRIRHMSQENFQKVMGKIEVFGEVLLKLRTT